ncbi:MAG: hypothetical protein AAFQ04_04035 [Pseudomonadota bacterium]
MPNKFALGLGLLVLIGIGVDYFLYDLDGTFFLARKTTELIEWMAFWR